MQVTVEDVSSVKKKLLVEIPEEQVTRELDKAYAKIKKSAKIRGFRPGKAPRSVLERLFKKDIHADVSSRLIQESFFEAIQENDLRIVGTPQIDPPAIEAGQAYRYEAAVEISPPIDNIDFKDLTLKKARYTIGDEEVETQLKMLQKRLGHLKPIEKERPLEDGDFALIDYEGFKDGKPFDQTTKTEKFTLKMGDGQILKAFDDQIAGMKPGEEREISVSFPEDYFNKSLAALDIGFKVMLHEIREEQLPEIDDEMAKDAGKYETLEELKTEIRKNLNEGYEKRTEQELNEQIFQVLIEKISFELPETLVKYELEGIVKEAERTFAYQNQTMEGLGLDRQEFAEKYRETAEKQVRRYLILNKIIEQEGLKLADDDLEQGFEEMAASFNQSVEEIKTFYQQKKDKLDFFKHALLEKQAIKLIIDSNQIEEIEKTAIENPDAAAQPQAEEAQTETK